MGLAPIVALEIGTSKVIALVGELREENHIVITGMGEHSSSGVRKGEMVDFENARICVKEALGAAEETAQVAIHQVHLALCGGNIQSLVNRGTIPITNTKEGVTQDDVEQVTELARSVTLPPDRQVLHSIGQIFYVDGERVARPDHFDCSTLALDMLLLHAQNNHLRNTVRLLRNDMNIDVADTAFGGLCSALAVLTPEQKEGGVLVIDLGGGTTTFTAYAGGIFAAAGAYAIGGDHVTNDIALAFNIPRSQAEQLKKTEGSAIAETLDARAPRIALPAEVGYPGRNVSLSGLQTVIHLRMSEIFQLILRDIERRGIGHQIGAGVVLTGGGAQMKGLIKLVERIFRTPCMVGRPMGFSGLAAATEKPECSTTAGLLRYAFKNATGGRRRRPVLDSLISMFTGR